MRWRVLALGLLLGTGCENTKEWFRIDSPLLPTSEHLIFDDSKSYMARPSDLDKPSHYVNQPPMPLHGER